MKLMDLLNDDLRKWFGKGKSGSKSGGGWDRYSTTGENLGKCGAAEDGEPYSACLSQEKAKKLGKDGIASFVKRKRAAQKRGGDAKKGGEGKKGQRPIYVKTGANMKNTEKRISENLELFLEKNCPNDPSKWKKFVSQAKRKFDVYPSAYANGWAAKQYKAAGGTWRKCDESVESYCPACLSEYINGKYPDLLGEAKHNNKDVKLGKPFRTPSGPKKFSVYVKNNKGNVVKVNFGDPNMEIKRDSAERRKSFRARHNCDSKTDKTTAGYWSCKFWEKGKSVSDLTN